MDNVKNLCPECGTELVGRVENRFHCSNAGCLNIYTKELLDYHKEHMVGCIEFLRICKLETDKHFKSMGITEY